MVHKKFIAICLVSLAIGAILFSACRHYGHEDRGKRFAAYLADELELTTDQKAVLDRVHQQCHSKREEMRSSRMQVMEDTIARFKGDRFDREFLIGQMEIVKPQMEEMATLFADGIAEFHSVLTPEQRGKLVAKIEDWKKMHRYFHE